MQGVIQGVWVVISRGIYFRFVLLIPPLEHRCPFMSCTANCISNKSYFFTLKEEKQPSRLNNFRMDFDYNAYCDRLISFLTEGKCC